MAGQAPDAGAITVAYQRHVQAQRAALEAALRRLWTSLGEYREPQLRQFVQQAVPTIAGAQMNMAALTTAYLTSYRQARLGGNGVPVAVDPKRVTGSAVRGGTQPAVVYERPFHLVWRQLAAGKPLDQAVQAGVARAVQSALTDLQLTKTHTARQILSGDKAVIGFRRVLEVDGSCPLCVVAATRRYHRGDLLPAHPVCDCSVAPLYANDEQQQLIDPQRLASAHQAIKDTFGVTGRVGDIDYRKLLVVHEHGELGPVLARKGASLRGPDDL